MSNISVKSNPSNINALPLTTRHNITYKDLLFHNFAGANKLIVSIKDDHSGAIPITIPTSTTLLTGIDIDTIVDVVSRIQSIRLCNDLTKKHHASRRLCIYHNSMLLVPIVDLLIDNNSYSSYHIFTSTIEMNSMAQLLLKKHSNSTTSSIRYNSIEPNIASMLRIISNEYEDLYDDRTGSPFDSLILIDYSNSIEELCEILKWRNHDTYISMPYSYIMISLLRYFFRYYCDLDVVSNMYGYCIVKVSRNNTRSNVPSMYIWNKIVDAYVCVHDWLRPMFQYKAKNNT